MAAADYALCDQCGSKTFYDAEVDYEVSGFAAQRVLCSRCYEQGYRLAVIAPQ
jgi:hypothetical protein